MHRTKEEIIIPQKSKRQLESEFEESNRYRILKQYYDVNERIRTTIETANDCIR